MQLTEQQQAIVEHNYGPARVFAVAGAGKTTAMVHRISRLVRESIFSPQKILATSFSRASVSDIENELKQWAYCCDVKTRTLHQVGNYVIKLAIKRGYLSGSGNAELDPETAKGRILNQALSEARKLNVNYKHQLDNIDQEDFLSYVSKWKGNLSYANLEQAELPSLFRQVARQAEAPTGFKWYLDLYQLFEQIRLQKAWITFDDMLMTGWELLVKHPDLLQQVRTHVECVIVDEFQDVNLAQFEMLDLISAGHRNYMVIGDDDQTIYEWRGASTRFILEEFNSRYHPQAYLINDNFRCKASQLVLANEVIKHNRQRAPKHLSLTQGFDGSTVVHCRDSLEQIGCSVVSGIKEALNAGIKPADIAVLVRVHAQTPYIEQFLIKERIPYGGSNLKPFYERPEIVDLLSFCRLAKVELDLSTSKLHSSNLIQEFKQAWDEAKTIPPIRYLTKDLKQKIHDAVVLNKSRLSEVLLNIKTEIHNSDNANKIEKLADWLVTSTHDNSAAQALKQLDYYLGYQQYLKHKSGFAETGESKAANVEAFIDYAKDKGDIFEFMQHIEEIAFERLSQEKKNKNNEIKLTTIHQSKGLEWQIVFVPNCNQGVIPFGKTGLQERIEEERRLFYVAITRSKRELHLYFLKNKEISQFLQEANYLQTLARIREVETILAVNPHSWNANDVVLLNKCINEFHLEQYFKHWWQANPNDKEQIAKTNLWFLAAATKHQLLSNLRLKPAQFELWKHIAPLEEELTTNFPGIEQFTQTAKISENLFGKIYCGSNVTHPSFGEGTVLNVVGYIRYEIITVNFCKCGVKRIQITPDFCSLSIIHRW